MPEWARKIQSWAAFYGYPSIWNPDRKTIRFRICVGGDVLGNPEYDEFEYSETKSLKTGLPWNQGV